MLSRLIFFLACCFPFAQALSDTHIVLTDEEQAWLDQHADIRLGVDHHWPPFEFIDAKGQYRGMGAEYIALISQRLGIRMEPERGLSWSEVLDKARAKELDVLPAVMSTPQRQQYLNFTHPHLTFPMVIISRSDGDHYDAMKQLQGKRVAIVKGYITQDILSSRHPYLDLVLFETNQEALNQVATGGVDVFIGNLAAISHAIEQLGLTNLMVAGNTPYRFALGIGVRDDWPQLVTILEKALDSITEQEAAAIRNRWVRLQTNQIIDLHSLLVYGGPVTVAVLLIILATVYNNRKLRREITERTRAEQALQASQDKLLESQQIARIGSWEWDLLTNEVSWSAETYVITGVDPQTFNPSAERFLSVIHPEDRERVGQALQQTIENREDGKAMEFRLQMPNGEVRNVRSYGRLRCNEAGEPVYYSGVLHDVTDQKKIEVELQYRVYHDLLTGLRNRTYLMEQLQKYLSQARRHGYFNALLFFDLDNFKVINDSLGHQTGDQLLSEIGRRLLHTSRAEDTVARLGGDEFVIVASNLGADAESAAEQARELAEKVRETLSIPYVLANQEHHLTLSIGISMFPVGGEDVNDILKHADTAMYRAKELGRDTIRFFQPSMQQAAEERFLLMNQMRTALDTHEFHLVYQPQYDHQGQLIGAESLIRWQRGEEMISPARFIPLAEESGLILGIGDWVLEEACRQLAEWNRDGVHLTSLAINVSARQFHQAEFVDAVHLVIQETGIQPEWLELELTEGVLVENVEDVTNKMISLKELGVRIAIDDFGTGYSSLAYLKRLPLDRLKIDQSFVRDITTDASDAMIVETIIAMAAHLGFEALAEGVETDEERLFLQGKGCLLYQGYYFSRPLKVEAMTSLLALRLASRDTVDLTHSTA